jgi:hypothetical protein
MNNITYVFKIKQKMLTLLFEVSAMYLFVQTNLPLDNSKNAISWELEYTFSSNYNVTTVLNAKTITNILQRFKTDGSLFQRYVYYQSVSWNGVVKCEGNCKKIQLCSIQWADINQYQKCVTSSSSSS